MTFQTCFLLKDLVWRCPYYGRHSGFYQRKNQETGDFLWKRREILEAVLIISQKNLKNMQNQRKERYIG